MVLIKSDFNGIVHAITEGRRIFSNLKKSFSYLIAFHVPVVLLSFLPPLFQLGELLMPVHIILLELIVHPVSAFTFENLKHPESRFNRGMIDRKMAITAAISGVLISLFALFWYVLKSDSSLEVKRTLAFTTLLFGNVGFVLLETWPVFTKRLFVTIALLITVAIATFSIPTVADHLHFTNVPIELVGLGFIMGLVASMPAWVVRRFTFRA